MRDGIARRTGLLGELVISLVSGVILAAGTHLLTTTMLPGLAEQVPTWSLFAAVPTAAALGFLVARRLYRRTDQVFVVISASTHTRWLADVLDNLAQSLDRHGVDLVVKFPAHDHSGQSQVLQLASVLRKRRSYLGGFLVPAQPERIERELAEFCETLAKPVVFIDVRPFKTGGAYPSRTGFVGCAPEAIGQAAAQWLATELAHYGVASPSVFVVGGDSQFGRHERFESRLKELLPAVRLHRDMSGEFSRERARDIVAHYLRSLERAGESLDAIFCTNDEMALGAADAVQERAAGRPAEPQPLILGVDGIAEAVAAIKSGTTPLKATVVQDPRRVAEVAVDALLRMRAGEKVRTEIFVPFTVYPAQRA